MAKKKADHELQDILNLWDEYSDTVRNKLIKSYAEYGDATIKMPLGRLSAELQDECIDLSGWGMFYWNRIRQIEEKIDER